MDSNWDVSSFSINAIDRKSANAEGESMPWPKYVLQKLVVHWSHWNVSARTSADNDGPTRRRNVFSGYRLLYTFSLWANHRTLLTILKARPRDEPVRAAIGMAVQSSDSNKHCLDSVMTASSRQPCAAITIRYSR